MDRVYNFAAGPSMLPQAVLEKAQKDLLNYNNTGMSVMEMSHRSDAFLNIYNHTYQTLKELLGIPDTHEILFLQGGASTQFAMVPLNLIAKTGKADYALTGNFAFKAYEEGLKYGECRISFDGRKENYARIPNADELTVHEDASYFHYCANNTIYGTEWNYVPDVGNITLVCDMSSNITSKKIDISKYGLIYAGAQKNMAPAGVTVVIVRKDLIGTELSVTPTMLSYRVHCEKGSMYNTPPCWQIYMLGLQMDWIKESGGIAEMEKRKKERSELLYGTLENTKVFRLCAEKNSRSDMNVVFKTGHPEKDAAFIAGAEERGLFSLKGHRLVKGMRASIYNAMPLEGVKELCAWIEEFDRMER